MGSDRNFQKWEHELYRTCFYLREILEKKDTKRWNPTSRALIQQFIDLAREAAECAHNKQEFAVQMSIWITEQLPGLGNTFDENGFPANYRE